MPVNCVPLLTQHIVYRDPLNQTNAPLLCPKIWSCKKLGTNSATISYCKVG
jgi:hypothetical protein